MSLQLNEISIAGNIARDPEIKTLAGNRTVASFSVATNRRWKDQSGKLCEEATFIDCEAWGQTAEFISKWLAKGAGVLVKGRLRQSTWTDRETQKQRSKHSIVVDRVYFTDPKAKDNAAHAEPAAEPAASPAGVSSDDQPPF